MLGVTFARKDSELLLARHPGMDARTVSHPGSDASANISHLDDGVKASAKKMPQVCVWIHISGFAHTSRNMMYTIMLQRTRESTIGQALAR